MQSTRYNVRGAIHSSGDRRRRRTAISGDGDIGPSKSGDGRRRRAATSDDGDAGAQKQRRRAGDNLVDDEMAALDSVILTPGALPRPGARRETSRRGELDWGERAGVLDGFPSRPLSPRAPVSLGGYLSAAQASQRAPGPPRAPVARRGLWPPRARAAGCELPCGPQCLTVHPSALPVPYQCLTSALPSALPREPYEFTRRAHPMLQITSPA